MYLPIAARTFPRKVIIHPRPVILLVTNHTVVLHKLNIIDDRVAEDKDDFELNFYPLSFNKDSDNASSRSSVSLSKAPTRSSIVESIWSRKQSQGGQALETSPSLSHTQTWRSERADSVVGEAPIEEGKSRWSV